MITVKGNVVGGHTVGDIGVKFEYGEERTFTDDVWERSKDLKDGVTKKFLVKIRQWIDRKVGPAPAAAPPAPAPGRKVQVALAYPQPKAVSVPTTPVTSEVGPKGAAVDMEAAVARAVKSLIDSGVLVPASNLDRKLDELLQRPATVVVNGPTQSFKQDSGPAAPQFVPSTLGKGDITESKVTVEAVTQVDTTEGAVDALRNARSGKTPLRRPR